MFWGFLLDSQIILGTFCTENHLDLFVIKLSFFVFTFSTTVSKYILNDSGYVKLSGSLSKNPIVSISESGKSFISNIFA